MFKRRLSLEVRNLCFGLVVLAGVAKADTRVAITVDDLPTHGKTSSSFTRKMMFDQTLGAFKKHGLSQVYGFINAKKDEEESTGEALLRQWISAGQLLGNHTYAHVSLTKTGVDNYISEIEKNEPTLSKLMEGSNFKFFRYPFLHEGNTVAKRNAIRAYLTKHGYQIAEVTIDWEDWAWNNPYVNCLNQGRTAEAKTLEDSYIDFSLEKLSRAETLSRLIFGREIPQVLLVHIGAMNAKAMDRLLTAYEAHGVRFISLTEALKDDVYRIDPGWLSTHGENFLDQIMQARDIKYPRGGRKVPTKEIQKVCSS